MTHALAPPQVPAEIMIYLAPTFRIYPRRSDADSRTPTANTDGDENAGESARRPPANREGRVERISEAAPPLNHNESWRILL
jgi:hypothetical protein